MSLQPELVPLPYVALLLYLWAALVFGVWVCQSIPLTSSSSLNSSVIGTARLAQGNSSVIPHARRRHSARCSPAAWPDHRHSGATAGAIDVAVVAVEAYFG